MSSFLPVALGIVSTSTRLMAPETESSEQVEEMRQTFKLPCSMCGFRRSGKEGCSQTLFWRSSYKPASQCRPLCHMHAETGTRPGWCTNGYSSEFELLLWTHTKGHLWSTQMSTHTWSSRWESWRQLDGLIDTSGKIRWHTWSMLVHRALGWGRPFELHVSAPLAALLTLHTME